MESRWTPPSGSGSDDQRATHTATRTAHSVIDSAKPNCRAGTPGAHVAAERATLTVSATDVADLQGRLAGTRWPRTWPSTSPNRGGSAKPDATTDRADPSRDAALVRRLARAWQQHYDWPGHETVINALPSFLVEIDGTPVHFLRYDGESDEALPIVITHGWPSSFLEMIELAQRLSTPSRYGGDPSDSFTVIAPSLPGFGLSPQRPELPAGAPTHGLWHRLMHDHLGFARYAAHGGDLGAGVTSLLAQDYPDAVVGVHLLAVADPADFDVATLTDAESAYLDSTKLWFAEAGGYEHEQMTRPVTLSYGLTDSPVALLAWIVEKYREWSDCDGDVSRCFSDDFLLTQASLYWFTNSISTSFRPYFEYAQGWRTDVQRVEVPTAVAVFPKDLTRPPRSWAARTYNVTRYTEMPRGGHFAAYEQPELLASDLIEFFGELRKA